MKIAVIHGQNHHGNTYQLTHKFLRKVSEQASAVVIKEFFLPKDFSDFCVGCAKCFLEDETLCPHAANLDEIREAMDDADLLVFSSPVYCLHLTGEMKAFLDHFGYRFMAHRPEKKMFSKQAVIVTTAAGAGLKSTAKDIEDSLFFWGVPRVYRCGLAVWASSFEAASDKTISKMERLTDKVAKKVLNISKPIKPGLKQRLVFMAMRAWHKKGEASVDTAYWQAQGWLGKMRPWH